ncbi:MAG: nucleotidyltransferase substrate binding protein [Parcubacteria group bacterium Gr01-1014_8]|nr:MAG: nucleotidyltransferase substrate binding protein [Parcubacteria group bacterium Gr01-1014_8]
MDTIAKRTTHRFGKAVEALEKALALKPLPENAERDAVLLRFELAAELMPKVLQRILAERGADVALPKDVVRSASAASLVSEDEGEVLLAIIDDRNRMVHDYGEEYASKLLVRVREEYALVLHSVADRMHS